VRIATVFGLLLCCTTSAFSQIVRGTIVDESTNAPLNGVFVVLLDSIGRPRGGTLTDEKGFYAMRAPYEGSFALRAERIGHRSTTTAGFVLSAAQAHSVDIRVPIAPIGLAPIDVRAARRCEVRPEQGRRTAQLWEEARKALAVTQWVKTERPIRFEWRSYVRELDPHSLEVRTETTKHGVSAVSPYRAVSADSLARFGFVQNSGQDVVYYGPDAEVLLSDVFLEQHCFRSVVGSGNTEGLVGLAFEPVRNRELRDITGTLWLDAKTLELHYLEFRYTNLPRSHNVRTLGGRTDFRRLSTGAWIVERWYIRMPMVAIHQESASPALRVYREPTALRALREEGGEVSRITDAQISVKLAKEGLVRGVVYDSVRGQPLPDATVYLSGTSYRATTDSAGAFTIPDVAEGRYVIAFAHTVLDSLPAFPLPRSVVIQPNDTIEIPLAIASVLSQMSSKCGPNYDASRSGAQKAATLFGYVFDGAGKPVNNAVVRVLHKRYSRASGLPLPFSEHRDISETKTDQTGRYSFCSLPINEPLTVSAKLDDDYAIEIKIKIEDLPFKRLDLVLR
jgi:hypothetical protein